MSTQLKKTKLLKKVKPLVFCEDKSVFKKFMDEYIIHRSGFFILAPSGTGKSYFVKNQKEKHWMDGDILWEATGAHPKRSWWTEGLETIFEVDQRSDVITHQAKKLGLWILGASNYWLKPDAIVLPELKLQKKFISKREEKEYDGGAKSEDIQQVLSHREWIKNKWKFINGYSGRWDLKSTTPVILFMPMLLKTDLNLMPD